MKKEIIRKIKQLLRFITLPYWFPIALLAVLIQCAWDFCEECPHCGWDCNCPKGFGANK